MFPPRAGGFAVLLVAAAAREAAAEPCTPQKPGTWDGDRSEVVDLSDSGKARLAAAEKLPEGPERRDEAKRAADIFREVDDRSPCLPANVVRLGQSLELQGLYVDAMREYRRIVDAKDSLGKQSYWKKAVQEAEELASSLEGRTPAVVAVLEPSQCDRPTVLLDAKPVKVGARTPVDPGPHTVTASAGGCSDFSYPVVSRPGDTTQVSVHLTKPSETPKKRESKEQEPPVLWLGLPPWVWGVTAGVVVVGVSSYFLFKDSSSAPAPAPAVECQGTWGCARL